MGKYALLTAAGLSFGLTIFLFLNPELFSNFHGTYQYKAEAQKCLENSADGSSQMNCWNEMLKYAVSHDGSESAMQLFTYLYDTYPTFTNSGCHARAHQVGDFAYYHEYLNVQDVQQINFPEEVKACGSGFLHGFFEHLFQDSSSQKFIDDTCGYLIDRYSRSIPHMDFMCYHGAGHGLLLAQLDDPNIDHFDIYELIKQPLSVCFSLKVELWLQDECQNGVFNVFAGLMQEGAFGYSIHAENLYFYCDLIIEENSRRTCYRESTRKIGWVVSALSEKYDYMKSRIPENWFPENFWILAKGVIAEDPQGDFMGQLLWCRTLQNIEENELCIKAIPHGLIQHGTPMSEYVAADIFCSSSFLYDSERQMCNDVVIERINTDLAPLSTKGLCAEDKLSDALCSYYYQNKEILES